MTDSRAGPARSSQPLVAPDWLQSRLGDPAVAVIEVASEPDGVPDADGNIPEASVRYWKDLVWDTHRRDVPPPAEMARRLGECGVGEGTAVVLYAERNQFAVYCYWVLHELLGYDNVSVLDGGKVAWRQQGRPTVDRPAVPARVPGPPPARHGGQATRVFRDELLSRLSSAPPVLLDARLAEEYDGHRVKPGTGFDHGAERHGHIPGAKNLVYETLLHDDATFLGTAELAERFRAFGAHPDDADEVVAYCRLGHRASLVWFAASQLLGWDHVRVYDGSWTEWGSLVGAPIER